MQLSQYFGMIKILHAGEFIMQFFSGKDLVTSGKELKGNMETIEFIIIIYALLK